MALSSARTTPGASAKPLPQVATQSYADEQSYIKESLVPLTELPAAYLYRNRIDRIHPAVPIPILPPRPIRTPQTPTTHKPLPPLPPSLEAPSKAKQARLASIAPMRNDAKRVIWPKNPIAAPRNILLYVTDAVTIEDPVEAHIHTSSPLEMRVKLFDYDHRNLKCFVWRTVDGHPGLKFHTGTPVHLIWHEGDKNNLDTGVKQFVREVVGIDEEGKWAAVRLSNTGYSTTEFFLHVPAANAALDLKHLMVRWWRAAKHRVRTWAPRAPRQPQPSEAEVYELKSFFHSD